MDPRVTQLMERFRRIGSERMRDLPLYHHGLQVEAVDFQSWDGGWIGVLITPWFINIILLTERVQTWKGMRLGQKVMRKLPAGEYEFVVNEDEVLGNYLFRSVASPVLRFKTQEAARETARSSLQKLMAAAERGAIPVATACNTGCAESSF